MLPVAINMPGPATADMLPKSYLYKTRGHHAQHVCLRLFVFLKGKGVDRGQAQHIVDALGTNIRSKLSVDALLADDIMARKIFVTGDCHFIFPPEAKPALVKQATHFINAHPLLANWFGEQLTSEDAVRYCPSQLYTGAYTRQV